MQYTITTIDSSTRYTYTFEDNTSCVLSVGSGGVIYIEIKEYIPYQFLCSALNEVSDFVAQKGMTPKINIANSNGFLKILAKKCNYRKLPSRGVSFSIWTRP